MNLVLDITLAIHLLAFAVILGGVLAETKNFKTGAKVNPGILHGSWLALLTGLIMTGLVYAIGEENINNLVLSIKGLLLTAIFFIGYTNHGETHRCACSCRDGFRRDWSHRRQQVNSLNGSPLGFDPRGLQL